MHRNAVYCGNGDTINLSILDFKYLRGEGEERAKYL